MVNQAICKYCLATFIDPFGRAQLSHHLFTFHFNHDPESHMISPHSSMPTPSGTPVHLGTPGFPGLAGQNRQTATLTPSISQEMLFQNPMSTFVPSVQNMGQRTFFSQPPLTQPLTHNDVIDQHMERIRLQQTMHPMHSGAHQVNEEYNTSIFTYLKVLLKVR